MYFHCNKNYFYFRKNKNSEKKKSSLYNILFIVNYYKYLLAHLIQLYKMF